MSNNDDRKAVQNRERQRTFRAKRKALRDEDRNALRNADVTPEKSDIPESVTGSVTGGTPLGGPSPRYDPSTVTLSPTSTNNGERNALHVTRRNADVTPAQDVNRRIVRKCEHGWPVDIYGETACDRGCNFSGDLAATNDFDLTELNDFRRDLARYWILRSIADNLDHARYVASLFPSHLVRDALKNRTFNEPRRADYDENGWRLYEEKDTI